MGFITTQLLQIFANTFADKIDSLFVSKVSGKDLSSNDYTTEEKNKLGTVSQGAQPNIIESISVRGVNVPISEKNANLEVLVASDLLSYYTSEQVDQRLSTIPKFNIVVAKDGLPTSNISDTTVYLVPSGSESQNMYTEYIYVEDEDGNWSWETLGTQSIDLSGYLTKDSGLSGAQRKDNTTITFTRGDGSVFDVTIVGTTYEEATQSTSGLMSASDKTKLDGVDDVIDAVSIVANSALSKAEQALSASGGSGLGGGGGSSVGGTSLNYTTVNILVDAIWSGSEAPYTKNVTVQGVTSNSIVLIAPDPSIDEDKLEMLGYGCIIGGTQSENTVQLLAYGDPPEEELPLTFIIIQNGNGSNNGSGTGVNQEEIQALRA